MKNIIFSFVWAGFCAFAATWLLLYVDAKINFSNTLFFPAIVNFIHSLGWSARIVAFFVFYVILWLTGVHKIIGNVLLFLIGIIVCLFIGTIVIWAGYWFVSWLVSCL